VTIKAVRHYHGRGLLPEPPRDASGYRRYTAQDAIALVKIRTLAEAGVPRARVRSLLAADPGEFAAAIGEIDRTLQERVEELLRTRERITHLSAGDRLFVSEEVADVLDRLRQFGVSQRTVQMERDLWILMQSVAPAEAADWIGDKREALADPEFRAIYLEYDAAFGWPPDDSRLEGLAERARGWLTRRLTRADVGERVPARSTNQSVARLVAASSGASSPAWDRLAEIARQTGRTVPPASVIETSGPNSK
jgi:DNA-binding transcriptional MerR regulator